MIAKTGDDAAVAGRIESRDEQSTGFHKRTFKVHRFTQQRDKVRLRRDTRPRLQVTNASVGIHHVQDARVEKRTVRADSGLRQRSPTGFEHRQRRSDSYVLRNECANRLPYCSAVEIELPETSLN